MKTRYASSFAVSFVLMSILLQPTVAHARGISSNFGKWTDGVIPWVYNPTDAPMGYQDSVTVRDRIEEALAEWSGVCGVSFVRANGDGIDSQTGIDQSADDNIVVFSWDESIPVAGLAGPKSTSTTTTSLGRWTYVAGTLQLKPSVFDQTGQTGTAIDRNLLAFNHTVLHEVGHIIGLGHSDDPVSIMFANPYNSLNKLRADDIKGCRDIYGYSRVYKPPATFSAGTGGTNVFNSLQLVATSDSYPYTSITSVDDYTDDGLGVAWLLTGTPGYSDSLTQVVVDPQGYLSTLATSNTISNGTSGFFSIASFDLLRELPGTWTVYVSDSTGLLAVLTIDVNTASPTVNARPTASISYSENPQTREISVTATVSGDAEGDNATIVWHVPTSGVTTVSLAGSSGSDTQQGTLNNSLNNEIFVEVNDDSVRYPGTDPGTTPVGVGFQNLFRYNSTIRNIGPDHDGDNSSDILWRNTSTGSNWLYAMGGNTPKLSAAVNKVSDLAWEIVGTGDYDGDGKSDILWRNSSTGLNWMQLMDGAVVLTSARINTVSNTLWKIVGSGDYDGDGKSDILWRHDTTGQNWMYLMDGSAVVSSVGVNTVSDTAWNVVGSGDYNGDGNSDILWRNTSTGKNWMYLMKGSTVTLSTKINTVPDQRWEVVGSSDFNGDGNSDILWRHGGRGENYMYLMDGPKILAATGLRVVSDLNWKVAGNGDYDGDSKADILWRNSATGKNWVSFMDGATRVRSVGINTVADHHWQVVKTN